MGRTDATAKTKAPLSTEPLFPGNRSFFSDYQFTTIFINIYAVHKSIIQKKLRTCRGSTRLEYYLMCIEGLTPAGLNKIGNVRVTFHLGALVQLFLWYKKLKYYIF